MPDIVLATLNARFIHASFGLRYLRANLGELRPRAEILEFTIQERPLDVAERILARDPRIVGLGVYIWNVAPTTELVALLKRLRPDLVVVLGGPEVSHETESQEIVRLADHTITGEADLAFAALCRELLDGRPPPAKVIAAPLPALGTLALPYDEYTADDIAHRLVYVEASRGCPFECEFCLSSLDIPVRQFPLEPFLAALDRLLARGVRHFKFVDRTFNLNLAVGRAILEFFLARLPPGLFLHFEMIPDRLPAGLRELIARFPAGTLQFEVGIQTFHPEVAARISRRQDYARLEENFRFLREATGVHVHADLIAGLPGESLESFAAGFDRLVALGPQEIQVGILKRLRGTPIGRHAADWGMVYSPLPPYEILRTSLIDFPTMQRLRRFARFWDLIGNSGNFTVTRPRFWHGGGSPFAGFMVFCDWFFTREGRHHGIALARLIERVGEYLVTVRGQPAAEVAAALAEDGRRAGRPELPPALRPLLPTPAAAPAASAPATAATRTAPHTRRQALHASTASAPGSASPGGTSRIT